MQSFWQVRGHGFSVPIVATLCRQPLLFNHPALPPAALSCLVALRRRQRMHPQQARQLPRPLLRQRCSLSSPQKGSQPSSSQWRHTGGGICCGALNMHQGASSKTAFTACSVTCTATFLNCSLDQWSGAGWLTPSRAAHGTAWAAHAQSWAVSCLHPAPACAR